MASESALLLSSYADLVAISEQQVNIADQARFDEQLIQIQELEQQKGNYQSTIEQISSEFSLTHLSVSERETILTYIERLQQLNSHLQQVVTGWYGEDSKEMKQVSVQRKTLQSYGGVNHSDVISYYFDEKQ